ncbi:MAG: hydantoinase/oxoprolinase family protein [Minwuia sp.]|nr:hydantoinase/oxoprolinase family protein [Minwuia sp.]
MAYRISVDTGGTFTDVVVTDAQGHMTIGKALTTRDRISVGMKEAISAAASELGITFAELLAQADLLIYGTTRATNAIVTKTVAKTAFVTTEGFPDILLLKEGGKFNPHDFTEEYPDPYIPRRHTFEMSERIGAQGQVTTPLNETQARATLETIRDRGFEAIAVCLIWSIANPEHELAIGAMIQEIMPDVPFTLSHELIPIVREYRRASATAIDASLKPLMQSHLRGLEQDLREAGYAGEILVSTTAGGCNHVEALVQKPIYTIGSGPAMAPIAGLTFSQAEAMGDNVIICDTGGTTFDVGLVRDGRLTFSRDTWLGGLYTGDLLGVSSVDMRSIGAGGGSIAWVDEGGLMRVGPQSAGADPGPACYGNGGEDPTVSDAAVVLGYFDPDYFLGGRMTLDVEAARRAVKRVADQAGYTVEETAFRIMGLASDLMMRAISDITINEGFNPRESTIVAGGGAAGVNIMTIASELGCNRVILPKVASALSASGMQFADIVAEEATSLVTLSNRFDMAAVNATLEELENRLEAFRRTLPGGGDRYRLEHVAEARYLAQVWELDTPIGTSRFGSQQDLDNFVEAFHQVHERVFAVRDEGSPVEVVTWKVRLVVQISEPPVIAGAIDSTTEAGKPTVSRQCYFGDATPVTTPIFKASDIEPGNRISGPAIIEEPTTTLVVYPGMSATVSAAGNYRLDVA